MINNLGLYIHTPFCLKKCNYCDFYSVAADAKSMSQFADVIIAEIENSSKKYKDRIVDSIYIGGGTPNVLLNKYLEIIVKAINENFVVHNPEFTIELNPYFGIDFEFYKFLGINRISLGAQSMDDEVLGILGRIHNSQDVIKSLEQAKENFDNINMDLIVGAPKQSLDSMSKIVEALDFCKHVSVYMLSVPEGTPFYEMKKNKIIMFPEDDYMVDLYLEVARILLNKGFERYEVSNFCLPGYESRHNLKYWERLDYLGFGPSAHSFVNNERWYNGHKNYFDGSYQVHSETINDDDAIFEHIMLGLRLKKGLNYEKLNEKYRIDFLSKFANAIKEQGTFLDIKDGNIKIKDDFILLENSILMSFMK